MGLFLPVLLLGFAQPVDQAPGASEAVASRNFTLQSQQSRTFTLDSKLDSSPTPQRFLLPDPDSPRRTTGCFTMRSYYFERRDDLAPEYVGMTTCEPSRAVQQKRTQRRPARLVPASQP